jgi:hypothetical protein
MRRRGYVADVFMAGLRGYPVSTVEAFFNLSTRVAIDSIMMNFDAQLSLS